MNSHSNRETAAVALSLLDLTNLKDDCTEAQIDALCARAQTPYGNSAAICIWPRFVAHARNILGTGHPVRIATVVNFPSGGMEAADVAAEAREAIADGADEIDLVIPYRKLLIGNELRSASDGAAFTTTNPVTGAVLATVPNAGKDEIEVAPRSPEITERSDQPVDVKKS